jgi:hypothetical protein
MDRALELQSLASLALRRWSYAASAALRRSSSLAA